MNFSFHIFGNIGGTFAQYPKDVTASDSRRVAADASMVTLCIERDGNMMSYVFFRRFSSGCYVGLRLSLHSMQISRPTALMELLSKLVDNMLAQGYILRCNDSGAVDYGIDRFSEAAAEIESLRQYVDFQLSTYPYQFGLEALKGFPGRDEEIRMPYAASSDSEIEANTYECNRVVIDSDVPVSAADLPALVQALGDELRLSVEESREKSEEIARLQRQKKQFRVVIGLMVLLLGAGFWLYSLKGNLETTRGELSSANEKINSDSILIYNLGDSLTRTVDALYAAREQLDNARIASEKLHSVYSLPSWTSSNHSHNSVSDNRYYFYAYPGDELTFDYYVHWPAPYQ